MGIDAKGTRLFDRYALRAKIADTARGELWEARDEVGGDLLALELLGPSAARRTDEWLRMQRSHALATRLAHSNVLAVHTPLRSDTATVLPMQLAAGGNVRALAGGPYFEVLPVLIDVAEALRHAHRLGIAHVDLTAQNVLLDESHCALVRGFVFEGGTPAEFDAAARKDLRDFSMLANELLDGPAGTPRDAPPRLRALFDRIYDSSFDSLPMTFDEVVSELELSRHDTAPLSLANIDLAKSVRAVPVRHPAVQRHSRSPEAAPQSNGAATDTPPFAPMPDAEPVDLVDDVERLPAAAPVDAPSHLPEVPFEPAALVIDHSAAMPTEVARDAPEVGANDVVVEQPDPSVVDEVLAATLAARDPESVVGAARMNLELAPDIQRVAIPNLQRAEGAWPRLSEPQADDEDVVQESAQANSREMLRSRTVLRRRAITWRWIAGSVAFAMIGAALWLGALTSRDAPPLLASTRASDTGARAASTRPSVVSAAQVALPVQVASVERPAVPARPAAKPNDGSVAIGSSVNRVNELLVLGENAINDFDATGARRAFAGALKLDPTNARAASGLRRVRVVDGVRPLIEDARRAEAARDALRAAQGYAQALALDRRHDTARAGLARVRRAHERDPLMKALVLAYAELGSGRLETARAGFQQALQLHPSDWRASQGLARADAALTAKRLAPDLRRATLLEQSGNWAEALRVYEQILMLEPGYVLAQQGRQRVALRATAARDGPISVATGNTVGNGG
jgi:hypothetical protein